MTLKTYQYAYGRGTIDFTLDDEHVMKEIRTAAFEPMTDIKGGVL